MECGDNTSAGKAVKVATPYSTVSSAPLESREFQSPEVEDDSNLGKWIKHPGDLKES